MKGKIKREGEGKIGDMEIKKEIEPEGWGEDMKGYGAVLPNRTFRASEGVITLSGKHSFNPLSPVRIFSRSLLASDISFLKEACCWREE